MLAVYTSGFQTFPCKDSNPDFRLAKRAALRKFRHKSIDTFCFIPERSLLHKILGFIERLLEAAQRVLLSGQWLRITGLYVRGGKTHELLQLKICWRSATQS